MSDIIKSQYDKDFADKILPIVFEQANDYFHDVFHNIAIEFEIDSDELFEYVNSYGKDNPMEILL